MLSFEPVQQRLAIDPQRLSRSPDGDRITSTQETMLDEGRRIRIHNLSQVLHEFASDYIATDLTECGTQCGWPVI